MMKCPFLQILCELLYLDTWTRPDISTAVSLTYKYLEEPHSTNLCILKHLVRYVLDKVGFSLFLPSHQSLVPTTWIDPDWARDRTLRESHSELFVMVNGGPLICSSSIKTSIAKSTTEATFAALESCVREAKWFRYLFLDLGVSAELPISLFPDNPGKNMLY